MNPGTDYTANYGSPVYAVAAGVIQVASDDISGSGGRLMNIAHDDGTGADYLHLSAIAQYGGRVGQGALLGYSGASGNGTEWYYGPHLHISFRPNWTTYFGDVDNQDFDAIMAAQGGGTPEPPLILEDEMIRIQSDNRGIALIGPGYFRQLIGDEEVQNSDPLISAHYTGNDRQFDLWRSMALTGQAATPGS